MELRGFYRALLRGTRWLRIVDLLLLLNCAAESGKVRTAALVLDRRQPFLAPVVECTLALYSPLVRCSVALLGHRGELLASAPLQVEFLPLLELLVVQNDVEGRVDELALALLTLDVEHVLHDVSTSVGRAGHDAVLALRLE